MTADRARLSAHGALCAALLSLGLSTWSVACSERSPSSDPAPSQAAVAVAAAPAPDKPAPAAAEPSVLPASAVAVKKPAESAPSSAKASPKIAIRRVVVTHAIEDREPVAASQLTIEDGRPVFAFLELSNPGNDEARVVVTFEKGARSIGHVKLSVPAQSRRWRTWAKTRQLREAGDWNAVVRTESGDELSRTPFSIK